MNDMDKVEQRLHDVINSQLSANELSLRSGVALSQISRIRTGKIDIDNIRLQTVRKLYDVDIESINEN